LEKILKKTKLGYEVFPLKLNGKEPAISGWKEAATTDEQTIRDWFNECSGFNWGLHCKDMIVLDVDKIVQPDDNPFFERADFVEVPTQVTPGVGKLKDENGNSIGDSPGLHYFFKRPSGKVWGNKKYALNVDVKTDRGYIVIAPSTIDGKEYQFILDLPPLDDLPNLPDDVVKRLDEINAKPEQKADSVKSKAEPDISGLLKRFEPKTQTNWATPDDVRDRASKYVANCPNSVSGQGGHNATMVVANALVWGFALDDESAFEILSKEYNPRCEPEWSEKELRHKISQVHLHSPDKPYAWLLNETRESEAGFRDAAQSWGEQKTNNRSDRTIVSSGSEIEVELVPFSSIKTKPVEWLLQDMVALGTVTVFAGKPGIGKSFLTCFLASKVSSDSEYLFRESAIPKGSVIMINAEDPESVIQERLKNGQANSDKVLRPKALSQDKTKEGETVKTEVPLTLESVGSFRTMLEQTPDCRLIVIDPVSAFYGDIKEHSNTEIRAVLSQLKALAEKHKVAFVLISHTNKSDSTDSSNRLHGSRGLQAAARAVWFVVHDEDTGLNTVCCDKTNLSENRAGFTYSLQDGAVCIEDENVQTTASKELGKEANRLRPDISALAGRPNKVDDTADWLEGLFQENPKIAVDDIRALAEEKKINWKTVRRAKTT
ncbi:MAG: AAA family ATPase, partial [Thermoguttaceae bacterium]